MLADERLHNPAARRFGPHTMNGRSRTSTTTAVVAEEADELRSSCLSQAGASCARFGRRGTAREAGVLLVAACQPEHDRRRTRALPGDDGATQETPPDRVGHRRDRSRGSAPGRLTKTGIRMTGGSFDACAMKRIATHPRKRDARRRTSCRRRELHERDEDQERTGSVRGTNRRGRRCGAGSGARSASDGLTITP